MALKWIDGFENEDASYRWGLTGTNSLVAGRFGGSSLRLGNLANATHGLAGHGTFTTITAGIAIKPVVAGNGVRCLDFSGAGTLRIVSGASGGNWSVVHSQADGATSPGLKTTVLAPITTNGTWIHFEVSMSLSTTSGAITVKADGTQVYTYSGKTFNDATSTGSLTTISLNTGGVTGSNDYDDLWIADGTSHGDQKVVALAPATDVSTGWSVFPGITGGSHYAAVGPPPDFNPATWDATSGYVATAGGSSAVDTYRVNTPSVAYVSAVQVTAVGYKSDAGTGNIALMADGQQGATQGLPSATPGLVYQMFPTAAGSAAWTPGLVGTAPFGVKAV